jgi:hypothetical protein
MTAPSSNGDWRSSTPKIHAGVSPEMPAASAPANWRSASPTLTVPISGAGTFPARVASVDENFIVVKGGTRFGFSADLDGFHFYGADLCTQARIAGHTSYVIDFHLTHLSAGKAGAAFATAREAFTAKWARALEPTLIQTTCAVTALNPNPALGELQALTARLASAIGRRLKPRLGARQQTQRPGTGQVSDTASAARS